MFKQKSLFYKMVVSIMLLLVPVVIVYTYSNIVSERVVREEIDTRNMNRLDVSMNRLEADLWQVSQFLVALSIDSDTNRLRNIDLLSPYDSIELQGDIQEKLLLYQQLSTFLVDVTIFFPDGERQLSTMMKSPERPETLSPSWTYIADGKGNDSDRPYFVQHVKDSITHHNENQAVIVEARIYIEAFQHHLNDLALANDGYSFLYHPHHELIKPVGTNHEFPLDYNFSLQLNYEERGTERFTLGQDDYTLSYISSTSLDWVLVDLVPLEDVLSPIATTRTWFYATGLVLLLLGVAAAWLLNTQLLQPIGTLKDAILHFKRGHYYTRMAVPHQKEFAIAMSGFNDMADQIQTLIEEVYEEKIRSQQATLKLLQAQIDPHFLYNCLFYIKNMAKINNTDAVEAMALHLGDYFRYRTEVEKEETTVEEELKLVNNFLAIHSLRKRDLSYSMNLPDELLKQPIPPLLIQPIVENAIVHGIADVEERAEIRIDGVVLEEGWQISVEDNGQAVSAETVTRIHKLLESQEEATNHYGLRNVHQRMRNRFGAKSGVVVNYSKLGGLNVTLLCKGDKADQKGE
ncbi:cache domain-containing sensor histidine kinase [Shouchella lehensis]|uniref:Sensor histidine kinase n=1 Tax=Shouchella lehensis G1 TaxID=1246626 RepID=A0A060M0A0_9BACI|nr:histidine kinase [Shouchella lehensis]AIC95862.1 Sensor histidine kinase [Shouchella lehensis G1]